MYADRLQSLRITDPEQAASGNGILILNDLVGLDVGQFLQLVGTSLDGNGVGISANLIWDGPALISGFGTGTGTHVFPGNMLSASGPADVAGSCTPFLQKNLHALVLTSVHRYRLRCRSRA